MKYINAFVLSTVLSTLFLTSIPTLSDQAPRYETPSSTTPESQGGFFPCSDVVNHFQSIIDEGLAIARQRDPYAVLYEIRIPLKKTTSNCWLEEQKIVSIFRLSNGNTEVLEHTRCGYKKPTIYHSPFVGDYVLKWPLSLTLAKAIALKNAAGYTQPFSGIIVRDPLVYPSKMHPMFIFVIGRGVYVFVDSISGQVYTVVSPDTQTLGSGECTLWSITGLGVVQVCGSTVKPVFYDF